MSSVVVVSPLVTVSSVGGGLLAAAVIYGGIKLYEHIKQKKDKEFCLRAFSELKKNIKLIKQKIETYHSETSDRLSEEVIRLNVLENKLSELETEQNVDKLIHNIEKISDEIGSIHQKTIIAKIKEDEANEEISELFTEFKTFLSEDFKDSKYSKKSKEASVDFKNIAVSNGLYSKLDKLLLLKEKTSDILAYAKLAKKIKFDDSELKLSSEEFKRLDLRESLLNQIKYYSNKIITVINDAHIIKLENEAQTCVDIERLKLIKEQIKLKYSGLKEEISWTIIYKEQLNAVKLELAELNTPAQYFEKIEKLLKQTIISKNNFTDLIQNINDFITSSSNEKIKKSFIQKSSEILIEMGYSLITETDANHIDSGKIVYLDTKWTDYKIMIKTNENGELVTRLARETDVPDSAENQTVYQRQKDKEIAAKWCSDYDQYLNELKNHGIDYSVVLRKEPENEDVICIPRQQTNIRSEKKTVLKLEKKI